MGNHFEEHQYFRQWWIWLILLGINGIIFYAVFQQVIMGQPVGDNPASTPMLIFMLLFVLIISIFLFMLRLDTKVDEKGLSYRWYPFMGSKFKTIPWEQVKAQELIQYGFVGYGIRYCWQYGTIHNVRGNKGLQLIMNKDRKLLLGTQKATELATVLKSLGKL